MNSEIRQALVIYGVALLLCFAVGIRRGPFMYRTAFRRPFMCNWWCVSHFVLYTLLGYAAPSYWHALIAIGVLWELIELAVDTFRKRWIMQYPVLASHLKDMSEAPRGRIEDVLVNAAGVAVGVCARRVIERAAAAWR